MKKVIIFGVSKLGVSVYNELRNDSETSLVCFSDNNKEKHNTLLFNLNVYPPESLMDIEFDEIIIASSWDNEIKLQLISLGIDEKKIKIVYTNPSDIQFKNSIALEEAKQLMFDIGNLLTKNHIDYHIDHGTLLGFIRDKDILPWDIDIDLAILEKDTDKVIKTITEFLKKYSNPFSSINSWELIVKNMDLKIGDLSEKKPVLLTIVNKNSKSKGIIGLDLSIKYLYDENLYWLISNKLLSCPVNYCFPTKDLFIGNKTIKTPNNPEAYLKNLYGSWEIVDKKWSYSKYNNIDSQSSFK